MENPFEILSAKIDNIEQLLKEINNRLKTETEEQSTDKLFTAKEVVNYLDISVNTLYGMTMNKKIPYSKVGKKLYFSKIEIDNWIKKFRRKTMEEINEEAIAYVLKTKRKFN